MPYVIAFVIIVVAAGALLLFRLPTEAPDMPLEEARTETETAETIEGVPAGFTPPTTPPPTNNEADVQIEENTLEVSTTEPDRDFDPTDDQRSFTAEASYLTPRRTNHDIEVTLTLKDRVVVDANVLYDGSTPGTPAHSGFDEAYKSEVIGKRLNEIELSRTGGASLTSVAFNEAVASIRAES